jgi:type I restriction enzyme M protein
MALKKSELYSSLWQSCDELRGGMDASQYKDFVLSRLSIGRGAFLTRVKSRSW